MSQQALPTPSRLYVSLNVRIFVYTVTLIGSTAKFQTRTFISGPSLLIFYLYPCSRPLLMCVKSLFILRISIRVSPKIMENYSAVETVLSESDMFILKCQFRDISVC
jgi:hypothetical protein